MKKRKDGLYKQSVTVTEAGVKKRKYFYGSTKNELMLKVAAYQANVEKGKLFGEVAAEWWGIAEPDLAVNSLKNYRPAYIRAERYFHSTPIRSMKPMHVSQFLKWFADDKKAAEKTVKTQLLVVSLIFKYALTCGYVDSNPADGLPVPKGLSKVKREAASPEDVQRIKDHVGDPFGLFAFFALYTGMRRSEILALEWSDIDMRNNAIRISKSIYRDTDGVIKAKEPKTEAGVRVIPLLAGLKKHLKPAKGLVFPNESGGYITEGSFTARWKRYAKEAGISCTPHEIRHAYATALVSSGAVPLYAVQNWMGHAQYSTTKDIYVTDREDALAEVRGGVIAKAEIIK